MELTQEQHEIVKFVQETNENLMISALAGAAKTTTLVEVAKALPDDRLLCLAFNKNIAEEMKKRLPKNCTASTLNSLGHRTWSTTITPRVVFDDKKVYGILSGYVKQLNGKEKDEAWDTFSDILKMINWGKACGWIPDRHFDRAKRIMGDNEFFESLDEAPTLLQERLCREVTIESINQGLKGRIDYSDQILLPAVFPAAFDFFPHVLVDEAQDMSALNHAFLRKLVRRRITAVGDECQSIYAFRGAHTESMDRMRSTFAMKSKVLSISFRCPQAVVREAQWRAPHMRWPDWAIEGEVRSIAEWTAELIPDGAAVICRNNAPLFSLAMKLLQARRYPTIAGNEIGKGLLKIMRKFGPETMPRDLVIGAIEEWTHDKLEKSRSENKVLDQAACMKVFAMEGKDLSEAILWAEHLFASQGPIKLMTAHKSKGLEFEDVFILNRDLIRTEEDVQEQNLLYVAQTRAKQRLTYITLDGYVSM